MPFDMSAGERASIAIVGGGISGLAAAYLLAEHNDVTLYEAEPRLGGHARTVHAGPKGDVPVDTGFIVFNYANYPHLTAMFKALDVPVAKSDMTFGATINNGEIEYGLDNLASLTAQRRNLLRPGFLRMVRDILRFNARAEATVRPGMTVDDLMRALNLGEWFEKYYLLPISGAIWSSDPEQIRAFPADTLVGFFRNHALLSATGQHQWWTVDGGSIEYVRRLESWLAARGVQFRLGAPVASVDRSRLGVRVHAAGDVQSYDEVIFACHSDDALRLLTNPTDDEKRILSALRYQDNHVVLHRDASVMPNTRGCWSAWNYHATTGQDTVNNGKNAIGVTYWMNRLQNIDPATPLFVTLNPDREIPEHLVYDQTGFRHPVFDQGAIEAQGRLTEIQGENRTWFAGAYTRHGFHEDGFHSAVVVSERLMAAQRRARVAQQASV